MLFLLEIVFSGKYFSEKPALLKFLTIMLNNFTLSDSVLSQKLESFAVPVVEEYIESLELLSKTLSNIEFLVNYFGKFLPLDEEIDVMDYSELKSLYEDIVKQYTLPNNIVKEARAIFNAVERKHPHWQSTGSYQLKSSSKFSIIHLELFMDCELPTCFNIYVAKLSAF